MRPPAKYTSVQPPRPRGAVTAKAKAMTIALLLGTTALTSAGCSTLGRESCSQKDTLFGETAAHEDTKVVQRLLIALSTRDFDAFSAMQPSQSQYTAVAWRHGSARADALATVIQEPGRARREFEDLVRQFDAKGLEPRQAGRCTRRMSVNGEVGHPLYGLSVNLGSFAIAIPVYQSPDRTSLAGTPVVEAPAVMDTISRAVMLQVGLLKSLERARLEKEALLLLNDFLEDSASELALIRERVKITPWQTVEASAMSGILAPFHSDYGNRWKELQQRFPDLFESADFAAFIGLFYPAPAEEPEVMPDFLPEESDDSEDSQN